MGTGQPRKDIAFRAGNWCWYWLIKALTGKSDKELDKAFIDALPGDSDHPKTMYRIRGWGTSPTEKRGFRKARTIFEVAHELPGLLDFDGVHALPSAPRYAEACYLLVSPLWEILTTRGITLVRLKAIIESLLRIKRLRRFACWQIGVLERTKVEPDVTLQQALGVGDDDLLRSFRQADDIDSLALLLALYKEAVMEFELALALNIHGVVLDVVTNFTKKWRFPEQMGNLLMQLVMDRGLHSIWLTEEDWSKETGTALLKSTTQRKVSEASRRNELIAFVDWIVRRPLNKSLAFQDEGLPISESRYEQIIRDHFNYSIPK